LAPTNKFCVAAAAAPLSKTLTKLDVAGLDELDNAISVVALSVLLETKVDY
jgi:hypothetical protein